MPPRKTNAAYRSRMVSEFRTKPMKDVKQHDIQAALGVDHETFRDIQTIVQEAVRKRDFHKCRKDAGYSPAQMREGVESVIASVRGRLKRKLPDRLAKDVLPKALLLLISRAKAYVHSQTRKIVPEGQANAAEASTRTPVATHDVHNSVSDKTNLPSSISDKLEPDSDEEEVLYVLGEMKDFHRETTAPPPQQTFRPENLPPASRATRPNSRSSAGGPDVSILDRPILIKEPQRTMTPSVKTSTSQTGSPYVTSSLFKEAERRSHNEKLMSDIRQLHETLQRASYLPDRLFNHVCAAARLDTIKLDNSSAESTLRTLKLSKEVHGDRQTG